MVEYVRLRSPVVMAQAVATLDELTGGASGIPDEAVRRVHRCRNAGVTLPILRPAARHQTGRLIDLFATR